MSNFVCRSIEVDDIRSELRYIDGEVSVCISRIFIFKDELCDERSGGKPCGCYEGLAHPCECSVEAVLEGEIDYDSEGCTCGGYLWQRPPPEEMWYL